MAIFILPFIDGPRQFRLHLAKDCALHATLVYPEYSGFRKRGTLNTNILLRGSYHVSRRGLTAWTIIHFAAAHDRALDFGAAEMTWLSSAPVTVETVLLARSQALLLEPRDQAWRIDDAAHAVGSPRQADDLAAQYTDSATFR
jgi:hypothetical protein